MHKKVLKYNVWQKKITQLVNSKSIKITQKAHKSKNQNKIWHLVNVQKVLKKLTTIGNIQKA